MSSSRNYATALNLVWASRVDDDTPHPDTLAVFEALGLIDTGEDLSAGGWRAILPDDTTPIAALDDRGTRVGKASQPPPIDRPDPRHDGRSTPPGLRHLPPKATVTKPRPSRQTPAKAAPRAARAPEAPRPLRAAPRDPVVEARLNGVRYERHESVTAADPDRPAGQRGGARGPARKPIPHGTPRGYAAHYRRKEPFTEDCGCRQAWNARNGNTRTARRARTAVEKARAQGQVLLANFDVWLEHAQRSPDPGVRRKAAVTISALMALRIAVDDLVRAEKATRDPSQEVV